ncbi:lysosome membrane protein 2 [Condylostylus longicornis]|uniref:lysosome membrane protein 2 n=1 Tax=Condylostylus longicornis TaxID=2530218 RepID=UPI00244DFE95|nr:lysosome membrane protein 2 [Condylostylus longicornis]
MTEDKLNNSNGINVATTVSPNDTATSIQTQSPRNYRNGYKKQTSILEPVYKLVGIDDEPTAKELGTLILLGLVVILFIISVTGFVIMWFTEVYDSQYTSKLILSNGSIAAQYWADPPVSPHLKVHIFNYTNIDDYLNGRADKIHVDDLGPYTYNEHCTKKNVVFNTNFTVTYKDHRDYTFLPDFSNGFEWDKIVTPNVPLITAAYKVKSMSYFEKTIKITAIRSASRSPFHAKSAAEILWGYADEIIKLKNMFGSSSRNTFGMLMTRNGTSPDTFQIKTGEDGLQNLAVIQQFNGLTKLNYWRTNECNRIDGTDGSQFPPHLMENKERLHVFLPAFCRKIPLEFDEEIDIFHTFAKAWRYRTPLNVLSYDDDNSANQCYCSLGKCPLSGVFDGTLCYDDAPIFPSFPHFFSGDPKLYEKFEGIKPQKELHQTFADIHPRLAFPIGGASRIQINIQLHKQDLLDRELKRMDEGIILPILWLEITQGELNEELQTLIFHSTFSANAIQYALKYGTLLICVTTLALLVAGVYYLGKFREKNLKRRNLTVSNNEMKSLKKRKTNDTINTEIPLSI